MNTNNPNPSPSRNAMGVEWLSELSDDELRIIFYSDPRLATRLKAALAQQPAAVDGAVTGGGVVLPRYFLDFLLGQGALEGFWFSDKPATEKDQFWWRSRLRALAAQPGGRSDE